MSGEATFSLWMDGKERLAHPRSWVDGEERVLVPEVFGLGQSEGPGGPAVPEFGPFNISGLLNDDPFYVAHRCGGGDWPEFSTRGVIGSIQQGYKALEVSTYRCSTGEWVATHDWNTIRMTGESYPVGTTPWSTLSQLTSTAEGTTNPSQTRTPLILLEDILEMCGDTHVLFIDHKEISDRPIPNQTAMDNTVALLDLMDSIPGSRQRFVWKAFANGTQGAQMARARDYFTWGIYYSQDAPFTGLSNWDILGLNWNSSETNWNNLIAAANGKPIMAHIVTDVSQRNTGLLRGADGFMNSNPLRMGP